ncbi:hypothetical protein G6024_01150 [Dietzia maris]|nr:hypothetical protein [Dietzia maris]MBB0995729.1 hypothetical protein [Dietzia maris]
MTKRKAPARYAIMDLITGEIFNPSILARPPRARRTTRGYGRYTNTRSVAGNSMGLISLVCSGLALALVAIG